MSSIKQVNPGADVIGAKHAVNMSITAAKSLAEILRTNLGPRGTQKMLVGGAGQIKVTKDGKVLLDEMQIQHPTAAIIARTATAQEDVTGDGTTSNVLFTGELMSQAERYLTEGLHPRILVEGMELAREHTLKFLEEYKTALPEGPVDRETLVSVARTALRTKLHEELADHLTEIVVSAVQVVAAKSVTNEDTPTLDLHMIEIMNMKHQSALDTVFIDGLVLDHGARHPDMPKRSENAHIMILNVSLEYEKSEVNSGFFYKSADERSKLVAAERKFTDDKVYKLIAWKEANIPAGHSLIVINQKGIDPISLDLLQKAGIIGIRRAKRRNMERLARACGGYAVNSVDDMPADCCGFAKLVYEHTLGDDKYTFIEGCKNPSSCTILIKGPNDHTIRQIMDAVHDGLRAVKNVVEDRSLIPGGGAFEVAAHLELHRFKATVAGRAKIGVQAFADALLTIPKALASNSGLDPQASVIELVDAAQASGVHSQVGLDIETGKPILPAQAGIYDNYRVKKQLLHLGSLIAIKLLLVDEVMRAGRKMGGK